MDQASKGIKDKGVEVFALGIGSGVDTSQLRQIASSNDNVFTAPGFEELESVVKPIVEKTCPSKRSNTSKSSLERNRCWKSVYEGDELGFRTR